MINLLFYDDFLSEFENISFIRRIHRNIPEIRVHEVCSVAEFESAINKQCMDAMILDIMGVETHLLSFDTRAPVNSRYVGIELLKRVKSGMYQRQDPNVPVVMRTARFGESRIKDLCMNHGALCIVCPVMNDQDIITILASLVNRKS
jgi:hypothetical protein